MADVIITTDTVELFSHDVYFTLTLNNSASASYDARLLDMGKLKYTFDIPDSGDDTTAIGIKAGAMDIEIENFLIDSDATLIDEMVSAFEYSKQFWTGKMFWRQRGSTYGNPILFSFSQSDIEYDEQSETVSISLLPKQSLGTTAGEAVQLFEESVNVYTTSFTQDNESLLAYSVLAGDYVYHYLHQMYNDEPDEGISVSDEPILESSELIRGTPTSGSEWFIEFAADDNTVDPTLIKRYYNTQSPEYVISRLATFEGAIYGSALGKPFYVERKNKNNKVTISTDDIVEINQRKFFQAPYRNAFLTMIAILPTATEITEEVASDNPQAEKDINIVFSLNFIRHLSIQSLNTAERIAIDSSLIENGIENYSLAFSFENSAQVHIKAWGIGNIYPYSVINFDSNAPDFVKNKNFRVKKANYDFKLDMIEMDLYEI